MPRNEAGVRGSRANVLREDFGTKRSGAIGRRARTPRLETTTRLTGPASGGAEVSKRRWRIEASPRVTKQSSAGIAPARHFFRWAWFRVVDEVAVA
jgi:hypothetical protein